jgi:tetratricopeptide (TPR) repeat protein
MDNNMSNWRLTTLSTYGLVCFAILISSGCGSIKEGIGGAASMVGLGNNQAYEEGKTYFDAQAYDQAIQKFEQALGDNPGDTDIQGDLAKAKSLAAAHHFERGKELSEKHEINGALIAFRKAKTYQPQNVTYVVRYQEEKGKYDKLKADMERTVLEVGETKQWDEGLQTLATMKRYESSFPELATHVQEIRHQAAEYHEGRSDEKLTQQDFHGAAQEIEKAAEYDPSSGITPKNKARHHLLLSKQAWENNKYFLAYEEMQKSLEFESQNPELQKFKTRLVDQWTDVLYNEAIQDQNTGNLQGAREKYSRISQIKPGYLNVESILSELQGSLGATYYTKADTLMRQEDRARLGLALANYLIVREQHDSQYQDLEEKIALVKKMLLEEVQLRIAVHFENKSGEPGAGGIVYNQLLDRLRNSKKLKNLTLIERELMDEILQEQALGQGFLDPTTSPQVKKIKGAHGAIFGQVLRARVKELGRNQPTFGSSTYVSGTRLVPNPDYEPRRQAVGSARQEMVMAQRELTNAEVQSKKSQADMMATQQQLNQTPGSSKSQAPLAIGSILQGLGSAAGVGAARTRAEDARARLRVAEDELARTPSTIEEEVTDTFRYPIYDLKLEGEVMLGYRFVNFTTSEVGDSKTITKSDEIQDRYVQGDPGKGVNSNPNDLPAKEEFLQKLLAQAIEGAAQAIEDKMANFSESYYEEGKKAEEHGLEEDAIENYMRYIYSTSNLGSSTVQQANQYIYDKMGVLIMRRKES